MIPVVDLFAGPGGLGEGFSTFETDSRACFRIILSAEKSEVAHKTLRLRAFFRLLTLKGKVPDSYYEYVSGDRDRPYDKDTKQIWEEAGREALKLTLGSGSGNRALRDSLRDRLDKTKPWVLIGGPPCQAYSLVGRARNAGKTDYRAELDKRHFLYKQYLNILDELRPSIFVMENVKGLLSSKVGEDRIFHQMLRDLSRPSGSGGDASTYVIHSLVEPEVYSPGDDPAKINSHSYIVKCEDHGIPQRRHRVILLGVRKDLDQGQVPTIPVSTSNPTVWDAIGDLPPLRSGLSVKDKTESWQQAVQKQARRVADALKGGDKPDGLLRSLEPILRGDLPYESRGDEFIPIKGKRRKRSAYAKRLEDSRLAGTLNHSSRGHMEDDLGRYLFLSAFAAARRHSPATSDFPAALAADHANWESGNFADRFRVQLRREAATTITSHISKDGHYYVHPDTHQCRSFTVREAARIQSFPDNYFFEGPRTEQFIQTGNAVPPLVARQIAKVVMSILRP